MNTSGVDFQRGSSFNNVWNKIFTPPTSTDVSPTLFRIQSPSPPTSTHVSPTLSPLASPTLSPLPSPLPPKQPCLDILNGSRKDYFDICVPLYQAASHCNWAAAKVILDNRPELVRFAISESYDTALHVAASAEATKLTEDFVKNLVNTMTPGDVTLCNKDSNTALCLAVAAGNLKVVRIMLKKDNNLLIIPGIQGMSPLYLGALYGRRNIVRYLYKATRDFHRADWGKLLLKCLESDLFDTALEILTDNPELAGNKDLLLVLARKPDAFGIVEQNLIWRITNSIFRSIHTKVGPSKEDSDAIKLLKIIWSHTIRTTSKDDISDVLKGPATILLNGHKEYSSRMLFVAAEMGNTRFLVELLRAYPDLIRNVNDDNHTIFHIAIMHRHQDIHNLLYEIGSVKDLITAVRDKNGNNMLHLVGMTAVKMRTQTSGASLLMQRELLWFKEVEKIVPPYYKKRKNNAGQTPYELFSQNNQDLISQGLKWMKDCMVVATLIVTVAFAVAFTVPGAYNQDTGFPIFIHEKGFLVFVIADAISLVSSSTSLLVFLSILTSRYGQRDFMYSLPRMLMIGLSTLFISVAAMMVTFSASFFVLYRNGLKWVPILISIFAATPVIGFAVLQFPFLVDMFRSMYDSRYLFKPRRRML